MDKPSLQENSPGETYQVSARKHRPRSFDDVVGQDHIVTTLKNAIAQKSIAHAYLFCGIRGVGKTTCARIFAQAINCLDSDKTNGEPCGVCTHCKSYQKQSQFTIVELDAASNNSVENVREWVNEARVAPVSGKYKVYIIDEAHMLSTQAFNAFLKTLEEPPDHAIFILATTEKHKILPTILSRCQVMDFVTITTEIIVDSLVHICDKETISYEKEALEIIAEKADGSLRDALSIFDKVIAFAGKNVSMKDIKHTLHIIDDYFFLESVGLFLNKNTAQSIVHLDKIYRDGHQPDIILSGFNRCFRNLLVAKEEKTKELLDVYTSLKKKYADTAQQCSFEFIISSLSVIHNAMIHIRMAENKHYFLEYTIIQLSQLMNAYEITLNNQGTVSAKPLMHKLAFPVRMKKVDVTTKITKAANNVTPSKRLIIESVDPPNNNLDNLVTGELLTINKEEHSPISEQLPNNPGVSILASLREISRKKIQENDTPFAFEKINLDILKEDLFNTLKQKTNRIIIERTVKGIKLRVDESVQAIVVELSTEMDKVAFDKELLHDLQQLILKRYQQNIHIKSIITPRTSSSNKFVNNEEKIRADLAKKNPMLLDFIKRINGEIII